MNILKRLSSPIRNATQPWWVKIQTKAPECTYYFGPFDSKKEAEFLQPGYVNDLVQEGAQDLKFVLEKARPVNLTSCRLE